MQHFASINPASKPAVGLDHSTALPGGFRLETSSSVPLIKLVNDSGQPCGWLMGYPVFNGRLLMHGDELPLPRHPHGKAFAWKAIWSTLAGRYAAILHDADDSSWVYPDASGSFALLLNRTTTQLATHPELFPKDELRSKEDCELLDRLTRATSHIYPAGITPVRDTHPLLPNHRLHLETGRIERFHQYQRRPEANTHQLVKTIIQRVRQTLNAVRTVHPVLLNLTAGRDSRMLLACILDTKEHYRFFTNPSPDNNESLDGQLARALAAEFDLSVHTSTDMTDQVLAQGLGGEVGRCFFWRRGDNPDHLIDWRRALDRAGTTEIPFAEASFFKEWWASLPAMDFYDRLDHYYIEYRLGCTMGPAMHGHDKKTLFAFFPLNDPVVYDAMLNLPPGLRKRDGLFKGIIRHAESRLEAFPVNEDALTFPTRHKVALSLAFGNHTYRLRDTVRQAAYLHLEHGWMGMLKHDMAALTRRLCKPWRPAR